MKKLLTLVLLSNNHPLQEDCTNGLHSQFLLQPPKGSALPNNSTTSINDPKQAKAQEDSFSGMGQQKLVTKAMVKPVGYDVHNVHISVYIGG